jgi:nucleotide-binding universal stress UspA family protein
MLFAPKHILVPVAIDPDEDLAIAEDAVFTACDIAEKFSAKITLLHLTTVVMAGGSAGMDVSGKIYESYVKVLKSRLVRDKEKLTELQEMGKNRGINVESRVIDSLDSTASVILATALELKADLLVIGSHGRHGLSKVLFGSVAQSVATKASIPVLLLHPKKAVKK